MEFRSLIFFILLAGLFGMLAACENDIKDIEAIDRKVDNVDRYKNIRVTYSDSARIRVVITAPLMESHFETKNQQEDRFPDGVFVEFHDEKGLAASWLSAKEAVSYPNKKLIVVRDSVALVSIEGDTLRTEELFWNSQNEEIYTNGAFRYANKDERIYGYKFKSDQNFNTYSYEKMSGQLNVRVPE